MGLIYLDSCLLICLVEQDSERGARVAEAIAVHAEAEFAISPLVRLECLVRPLRDADVVLLRRYESMFTQTTALPMDDPVFDDAAHLRARYGLRTPDALHLSCAKRHGCTALWTNDARLARAGTGLALNVLD